MLQGRQIMLTWSFSGSHSAARPNYTVILVTALSCQTGRCGYLISFTNCGQHVLFKLIYIIWHNITWHYKQVMVTLLSPEEAAAPPVTLLLETEMLTFDVVKSLVCNRLKSS